jgi:hypothetical protein
MSKKNNPQIAEPVETMPLANPQGKTVEELKEVAMALQNQANKYREMTIKAQGALEVILQMIPEKEVQAMVEGQAQSNGVKAD